MKDIETPEFTGGIAIIGMTGRFPGASSVEELWQNLCQGVESITFFSREELLAEAIDPEFLENSAYVRAKGMLESADVFDAAFFGYNPREAELMDPQHRLFLECSWEALENAGYDPQRFPGRVGVFAGVAMNSYLVNLYSNQNLLSSAGVLQTQIANDKDYLPTRVSYKLGLTGPSVNVQTACSTSLVAVHLACQSLLSFESDMVLAGAVSISVPKRSGYLFEPEGVHSPDGHCRAFDAEAKGTLDGDGLGIVVLKRLEEALDDRDFIRAVILGSAVNNDGGAKIGYTAPSEEGQATAIAEALAVGNVDSESITYIETHGTGTTLGDPIEIAALARVFGGNGRAPGSCLIGSVKTNIGHLGVAAGMPGLIKAVKALEEGTIPPSLHFKKPNPRLNLESSPFQVAAKLTDWQSDGSSRRAGVSSFGIGGTNAHVVLEEAPAPAPRDDRRRSWHLLPLSAKTEIALEDATRNLTQHLAAHPELDLADVAYTLQVGRRALEIRRTVVCESLEDAVQALDPPDPSHVVTARCETIGRPVAFLFPGGGAQYPQMGRELYAQESVFRREVERCFDILEPQLDFDLPRLLFAESPDGAELFQRTPVGLPALFTIEYAMARTLMSIGIQPDVMIGHSLGEYVAACLAEVFSLEDVLALVVLRAQLIEGLPEGAMLSVSLPPIELEARIAGANLELAAVNAPSLCVVSGHAEEVEHLARTLAEEGVEYHRLRMRAISHSPLVKPILGEFSRFLETLDLQAPQRPFFSNLTGNLIRAEEARDPQYWVQHLSRTVRFTDSVQKLLEEPQQVLIEVGPGRALTTLALAHQPQGSQLIVPTMPHPHEQTPSDAYLFGVLGKLWCHGVGVEWAAFQESYEGRRVPLPTYPFGQQRYWVDRIPRSAAAPLKIRKRLDLASWFYLPVWRETVAARWNRLAEESDGPVLAFVGADDFSRGLVERLRARGREVVTVAMGETFSSEDGGYRLVPGEEAGYEQLITELFTRERPPMHVIHLWNASRPQTSPWNPELLGEHLARGFYSLLELVKALARSAAFDPLKILVVTQGMQAVDGDEQLQPSLATLLGPLRVIHQEYPHISCQSLDVILPTPGSEAEIRLVEDLLGELDAPSGETVVAYRRGRRWVRAFDPVRIETDENGVLRRSGAYLITGGLGRVGSVLAEFLAQEYSARLILTTRRDVQGPEGWRELISREDPDDSLRETLARLKTLEASGAEVLVVTADVSDSHAMKAVVSLARERFGALNGVFHTAGVVGTDVVLPIHEMTLCDTEQQFVPKIYGLSALEEALAGVDLDFCLLTSSLASLLGGLGYYAYSGVNAYMDAYAGWHNSRSPVPWISVNSDLWQIGEQAVAERTTLSELPMTPEEGVHAIRRLLALLPLSQVAVSTGDLHARIEQWTISTPDREGTTQRHARPEVSTRFAEPENEVQSVVAGIWQELLGIDRVGIRDSFFDLGGHSLLAVRLISALRDTFSLEFPLRDLFDSPTVSGMAKRLVELGQSAGTDSTKIARLVTQIDELSEEEVRQRLADQTL